MSQKLESPHSPNMSPPRWTTSRSLLNFRASSRVPSAIEVLTSCRKQPDGFHPEARGEGLCVPRERKAAFCSRGVEDECSREREAADCSREPYVGAPDLQV